MDADEVEGLFSGPGGYRFARWGRPVVPVVFGVEDATLGVVKGAIEAVVALAGHRMAETDPELGANLMIFFLRDWEELTGVPNLDRLLPDLPGIVARAGAEDAQRYRSFRFDAGGAIMAAFAFLRMDAAMRALPAETIALDEAVRCILCWSEGAFATRSPLAVVARTGGDGGDGGGHMILRPDVASVIRAAYDPVLPAAASDPAHALRLAARIGLAGTTGAGTAGGTAG